MTTEPTIPFGWKRITGQSQRGDGIWNGAKFVKVKKEYPHSEGRPGFCFIIRKCSVEQPALAGTDEPSPCQNPGCPHSIVIKSEETCPACGHCIKSDPEAVETMEME